MKLINSTLVSFLMLTTLVATGCTVIRNGNGEEGGTTGGGVSPTPVAGMEAGNGSSQPEEDPVNVDVLVLLPLDQSSVVDYYPQLISQVMLSMETVALVPRKVAIAPMYRRLGNEAPILWGKDDPESEFNSYVDVIDYYSSDDGISMFEDQPEYQDGQNLLNLGARLGMRSVFHPTTPADEGRYYFDEVPAGLVVLWINPFERRCDVSQCQNEQGLLVDQLVARDDNGNAAWLHLAGGAGLPAERVFHLFIATAETTDEESFFSACESTAGFPSELFDSISSSPLELYSKLQNRLDRAMIPHDEIDFCDAFSVIQSPIRHGSVALNIRSAMTR